MGLISKINDLREELHTTILINQARCKQALCSDPVVKCSQELDKLIELYYAQSSKLEKKGVSK